MLAALALAASMTASAPVANFGMAISPASVTGPSLSTAQFIVTDLGKSALDIRIQAIELRPIAGHPHAYAPYGEYDHARITAERFTLQPGQHRVVKVIISAKDSYRHDLGIAATGQQTTVKNGASVQTATIARYTVNPSGAVAPDQKPPVVADNHSQGHGLPVLPIAGGVVMVLLAGLAVWLRRKMTRHA